MQPMSANDLLAQALTSASPAAAALDIAIQLRDEGMTQTELLALYNRFRERHASDIDETCYNAILDTMDIISGWCSPSQSLYPETDS